MFPRPPLIPRHRQLPASERRLHVGRHLLRPLGGQRAFQTLLRVRSAALRLRGRDFPLPGSRGGRPRAPLQRPRARRRDPRGPQQYHRPRWTVAQGESCQVSKCVL